MRVDGAKQADLWVEKSPWAHCCPDNWTVRPALPTVWYMIYKNTLLEIYLSFFTNSSQLETIFYLSSESWWALPRAYAGGRAQPAVQLETGHSAGLPSVLRPDSSTRLWGPELRLQPSPGKGWVWTGRGPTQRPQQWLLHGAWFFNCPILYLTYEFNIKLCCYSEAF